MYDMGLDVAKWLATEVECGMRVRINGFRAWACELQIHLLVCLLGGKAISIFSFPGPDEVWLEDFRAEYGSRLLWMVGASRHGVSRISSDSNDHAEMSRLPLLVLIVLYLIAQALHCRRILH